jgi:hypothetical protein
MNPVSQPATAHAFHEVPVGSHVCEPLPSAIAQLCFASGVHVGVEPGMHALPLCTNPLSQLPTAQTSHAVPALLQRCIPVPFATAQLCIAFGMQAAFTTHASPLCTKPSSHVATWHAAHPEPSLRHWALPAPFVTAQLWGAPGVHG